MGVETLPSKLDDKFTGQNTVTSFAVCWSILVGWGGGEVGGGGGMSGVEGAVEVFQLAAEQCKNTWKKWEYAVAGTDRTNDFFFLFKMPW